MEYLYSGHCPRVDCPLMHLPKQYKYIDSHCHLDHLWDQYSFKASDVEGPPNFFGCIANFVFPRSYHLLNDISCGNNVWPTLGIHPSQARLFDIEMQGYLAERCAADDIVAIGETGLCSKAGSHTPYSLQDKAFDFQVRLASRLGKPVVIHCRDNSKPALDCCKYILQSCHKIHLHCFTGDLFDLECWSKCFPNLKVGVTGLLFDNAHVQDIVKFLPLDKILIETDAPHFSLPLTDVPFSFPQAVICIAQKISLMKKVSLKEVVAQTSENARFIYNLY